MNRFVRVFSLFLILVSFAIPVFAERFDPLFLIVKTKGECMVKGPKDAEFRPAEMNTTHEYGTTLKTGRNSSAIIRFSAGNQCRVLAKTTLTITEDTRNKKLKTVKLADGEVEISLEESFHDNNSLNVETPTAICGAIGCRFTVRALQQGDVMAMITKCIEGTIRVWGEHFAASLLDAKDELVVYKSIDNSLIILRGKAGEYGLEINDPSDPKTVSMIKDTVVKILPSIDPEDNGIVITVLINQPDGTVETLTYKITKGQIHRVEDFESGEWSDENGGDDNPDETNMDEWNDDFGDPTDDGVGEFDDYNIDDDIFSFDNTELPVPTPVGSN